MVEIVYKVVMTVLAMLSALIFSVMLYNVIFNCVKKKKNNGVQNEETGEYS